MKTLIAVLGTVGFLAWGFHYLMNEDLTSVSRADISRTSNVSNEKEVSAKTKAAAARSEKVLGYDATDQRLLGQSSSRLISATSIPAVDIEAYREELCRTKRITPSDFWGAFQAVRAKKPEDHHFDDEGKMTETAKKEEHRQEVIDCIIRRYIDDIASKAEFGSILTMPEMDAYWAPSRYIDRFVATKEELIDMLFRYPRKRVWDVGLVGLVNPPQDAGKDRWEKISAEELFALYPKAPPEYRESLLGQFSSLEMTTKMTKEVLALLPDSLEDGTKERMLARYIENAEVPTEEIESLYRTYAHRDGYQYFKTEAEQALILRGKLTSSPLVSELASLRASSKSQSGFEFIRSRFTDRSNIEEALKWKEALRLGYFEVISLYFALADIDKDAAMRAASANEGYGAVSDFIAYETNGVCTSQIAGLMPERCTSAKTVQVYQDQCAY